MATTMLLPSFSEGLESYHIGIATALADPTGKVYIDTSMLMWLLKIGKSARAQFFAWCAEPWILPRLFIPVWSVHELYRHLQDRVVIGQAKEFTTQYESSFRALVEHADMVGDDTLCANSPFSGRADLLDTLRRLGTEIGKCLKTLQTTDSVYQEAVNDLVAFVNAHSLGTDVFEKVANDAAAYEYRFRGRIPPGYKDGHKADNAYGDVVFWSEILEHGKDSTSVTILTMDMKTDWRHNPTFITDYSGREKLNGFVPGAAVQLPHPTLIFEAKLAGITTLQIVNAPVLSCVLQRHYQGSVSLLLAAAFPRPFLKENEPRPNWSGMGIATPNHAVGAPLPSASATSSAGPASTAPFSLSDVQLVTINSSFPRAELSEYRSMLSRAPRSDDEVGTLLGGERLAALSREGLIELGHTALLAAASNPSGLTSSEVLAAASSVSSSTESAVLTGLLLGLYFDAALNLRTVPLTGVGQTAMHAACSDKHAFVRSKVSDIVSSASGWLLVTPEDWALPTTVELRLVPTGRGKEKTVREISIGSFDLFDEAANADRRFDTLLGTAGARLQDLKRLLADQFAVPFESLFCEYNLTTPIVWPESSGLASMRIDRGRMYKSIELNFMGQESQDRQEESHHGQE